MEKHTNNLAEADSFEPVRLTSDFVFKYVFGSETSTSILRSFLTAVQTDAGLPAVAEVEIRNPFNPADSYDDKTSVVDVRARDVNGTVYTVEVQALPEAAFRERALYYWALAYAGQLGKGDEYEQLCPVVGVNIVDFIIFPGSQPVHTTFELVPRHNGPITLTDHLAIHFLELPKLERGFIPEGGTGTGGYHTSTTLQRWLYYMHERGEVDAMEDPILLQILKEDPDIEDAEERYRQFVANDELREKYQDRIKAERDRRSQIIYAERQGEKRGRIDVARRMKTGGMSINEIADLTGLSVEEIDRIDPVG
jgi:predicted transposase/invertase (TIGR01784 family)